MTRVRCVARKRYPLAKDLANLFKKSAKKQPKNTSDMTFVGHTRFATSSVNIGIFTIKIQFTHNVLNILSLIEPFLVSELHPHEWVPFREELIWKFDESLGKFVREKKVFGVHLSHNGDFDALNCYNQITVVGEVGLWLERVLNMPNNTRGMLHDGSMFRTICTRCNLWWHEIITLKYYLACKYRSYRIICQY